MSKKTQSVQGNKKLFEGLVLCLSGALSMTQSEFEKLARKHGAQCKSSVSSTVTHLVTNDSSYAGFTTKTIKAKEMGINIVNDDFILKSIEKGSLQDDDEYFFERAGNGSSASNSSSDTVSTTLVKSRKRTTRTTTRTTRVTTEESEEEEGEEEEEEEEVIEQPKAKRRRRNDPVEEEEEVTVEVEEEEEIEEKVVKTKIIKRGGGVVNPASGLVSTGEIYQSEEGLFAVTLNQTNIAQNNNKFYIIQTIKHPRGYTVFTQWGRVGEPGRHESKHFTSASGATALFMKKFRDKTGNHWEDRSNFTPKPRKYHIVDVSYDSDDDEDGGDGVKGDGDEEERVPDSKLDESVQDLIRMIANVDEMKATLKEFEIDTSRMPLGKLSKDQLKLGYEILKDLQEAIQDGDRSEIVELSSEFYTKIPHSFGRRTPPPIDTIEKLRTKIKMIESLSDMEIASKLLTETKNVDENPIDAAYHSLHTEIETLDHGSEEFKMIEEYVKNGHAPTHTHYRLELLDAFKVTREGEHAKFEPSKKLGNRRLLWHGSRTTNYMGILSQGLRIAPPEAPATGYMFGKGIYFADTASKSANYCATTPDKNVGLMLLSDVSLGKMYERTQAEYVTPQSLPKGCHSTWGKGTWVPDPSGWKDIDGGEIGVPMGRVVKCPNTKQSSLLYNEYIVYDVNQVNVRYLVKLRFNYKRSSSW